MSSQKEIFSQSEADAWFQRNRSAYEAEPKSDDGLARMFSVAGIRPRSVLEIGCANGFRLDRLQAAFGCECSGIDPSPAAIADGRKRYRGLSLGIGTADRLEFADECFDAVVFGFCLYLCDRKDLFRIAAEADRVLRDDGALAITDFVPPFPYRNRYSHHESIHSYKMDYSRMFSWNPAYVEVCRSIRGHAAASSDVAPDDRMGTVLLRKQCQSAYVTNPFS